MHPKNIHLTILSGIVLGTEDLVPNMNCYSKYTEIIKSLREKANS